MSNTLTLARLTLLGLAILAMLALWALRDLAVLVGYSVLLAYALLPIVRSIERVRLPRGRSLPRGFVAAVVMLALVGVVGWLVALTLPRLGAEATRFASNAPGILARIVDDLHAYAAERGFSPWLDPAVERARAGLPELLQAVGGTISKGAAGLFGSIGRLLGLALLPLLAFYLLAESNAVRVSALRFVPEQARPEITRMGGAVDRALRSYVRGQAIVCVVTGLAVATGLGLLHHPVALLLGLLAGAAEVLPYIGFLVVAIAIALAGSSVSPLQALLGLAVYVGLNWLIGTFVTPRVMGRYLKMHAFVVTVSVLAGAQLLGAAGALLALPVAAVLQAVIGEMAPERLLAARFASEERGAAGD
jgi:predicted PurR-regulated permease PerM